MFCLKSYLQLESDEEIAAAVVNITAEASTLESSALTVSGNIIQDLTDAAIEQPEVSTSSIACCIWLKCPSPFQFRFVRTTSRSLIMFLRLTWMSYLKVKQNPTYPQSNFMSAVTYKYSCSSISISTGFYKGLTDL